MEYTISGEGSSLTLTEGGEIGNVYDLLDVRTLKANHIQNVPVVQLTAADTDKDGYDELVITAGLNDRQLGRNPQLPFAIKVSAWATVHAPKLWRKVCRKYLKDRQ